MPFTCSIYGLGLQVNLPLSGLTGLPPAWKIDVRVEIGSTPSDSDTAVGMGSEEFYVSAHRDGDGEPEFRASRLLSLCGGIRMAYSDGTVFVIDGQGGRIWATTPPDQTLENTSTCLLGPIMGLVLRLRGVTCLHASAVAVDGQAIALVGVSGAGKSTTAAAFARLGYPVLCEDVLSLTDNDEHFLVQPGYPRIRLWPESVAGLFGSADALPRVTPNWDKRFLGLNAPGYRFQSEPLPLAAVYFLGPRTGGGGQPVVEAVNPAEALIALVSDSYATNFQDKPQRAKEFEVLSRLVQRVPLRRVTAADDFARIDELCNAITQDAQKLRQSDVYDPVRDLVQH